MKIPSGTVQPINSTDVIVSEHLPTYPDHREDARRTVWSGRLAQQVLAKDGKPPSLAPGEPSHAFMAGDGARSGRMTLFVSREMWADLRRQQVRADPEHVCDTPFWRTKDSRWECPDCGRGYAWATTVRTVPGVPASVCTVYENRWEPSEEAERD